MPTMTYPARLQATLNMTNVLKTITPANGYVSDIGQNVYRGRLYYGAESPVPMLAVLEVPIPLDQSMPKAPTGVSTGPWELMIQGWVDDDKNNPTDPAHVLLADVKKCLVAERARGYDWERPEDGIFGLGRIVTDLYIGAGVVRPPEEISAKAYFWLTVTLDLAENLEDPYTDL